MVVFIYAKTINYKTHLSLPDRYLRGIEIGDELLSLLSQGNLHRARREKAVDERRYSESADSGQEIIFDFADTDIVFNQPETDYSFGAVIVDIKTREHLGDFQRHTVSVPFQQFPPVQNHESL